MNWETQQAPVSMIKALSQLNSDLRANLERDFTQFADRLVTENQQFLQAISNNLQEAIRKTVEGCLLNNITVVSPPQQIDKPTSYETLKPELLLESENSSCRAEIAQLTHRLEQADSEVLALKNQLKATESRADQLRNIIIPNDGKLVLDSEIQQLFLDVRAATQVACRLWSKTGTYQSAMTEDSRAFFKIMETLSPEIQQDKIHAHLFRIIQRRFFPNRLRGCYLGNKYQNLQGLLAETEQELVHVISDRHP
ncbi:hypothetical protein FBEOM_10502 [Fusarium beomiforme]|uniref:Uncharacterized protein n=1 Tax=Fusarium beomiforme TaxID=44412 RepID=A0A9P5DU94_9HYPO|nr:hypothetical protein FBEOM_10502 [Fusarium beomiforme]